LADSGRVVRRTETIHKLRFDVVSKERNIQASVLSAEGDLAMMERLLDEITDTERIQPLVKVIVHLEKLNYARNERYWRQTPPGQKYDGMFAGSGGANFFFQDDKNRIFRGSLKDLSVSGQLIP
jgi:hypothetical protein